MTEVAKSSLGSMTYASWVLASGRHVQLDELTSVSFDPRPAKTQVYVKITESQRQAAIQRAKDMNQDHVPFITFEVERTAVPWTRNSLLEHLYKGDVEVEFANEAGDISKMICTLKKDLIPQAKWPKRTEPTTEQVALMPGQTFAVTATQVADPQLFKVYSIDRQGWRSFKLHRVIKVRV